MFTPRFMFDGLSGDRDSQCLLAACGPRLELRFGDQFFIHNKHLRLGSNWQPDSSATAHELYWTYLAKLKLPRPVSPVFARDRARRNMSGSVFGSYLLWASGNDLRDAGISKRTYGEHRCVIKKALGVDVKHPSSCVLRRQSRVTRDNIDLDNCDLSVAYDTTSSVRR